MGTQTHARRAPAPPTTPVARFGGASQISDGAMLERLMRMRGACHALAVELAQSRRRLRAVEAELQRLKERHGEH